MARPPRRRRIRTNLRCNSCGHQFEGLAQFVMPSTVDSGILRWMPGENAAMGHECPECGSEAIVVNRP